jgi:hypothetical protein
MDDLFRCTFANVQEHIDGNMSFSKQLATSPTKSRYISEQSERRKRLDSFRSKVLSRVHSSLDELASAKELLNLRRVESIDKCSQYYYFALWQLQNQSCGAERRMRELVFEVIGEYGKSILRSKRRHLYLKFSNRVDRIWSILVMRWKLFIQRVIYEALITVPDNSSLALSDPVFKCYRVLCISRDSKEMKFIGQVLASLVSGASDHKQHILCSAIKFDMSKLTSGSSAAGKDKGGGRDKPAECLVASTVPELKMLVELLKSRLALYATPTNPPTAKGRNGSSRMPLSPTQGGAASRPGTGDPSHRGQGSGCLDLLSISCIEWLRPSSFNAVSDQTMLRLNSIGNGKNSHAHRKHHRQNQFDCFSSRYVCQHSAHTSSDFAYFCLEERLRSELLEENSHLLLTTPEVQGDGGGRRKSRGALSTEHLDTFGVLKSLQVSSLLLLCI